MGISVYNIKKWSKMITGKSIYHVNQGVGKYIDFTSISGYYNDLTEKVTCQPELLETNELPVLKTEDGKYIEFSIGIFQYGLGAYDMYLQTSENKYLQKFMQCVQWALENQQKDGSWRTFDHRYPNHPYSAMAQGEGTSLLLRAHKEFGDEKYLNASEAAIRFMLKPISDGGTAIYDGDDVFFAECTCMPVVLNGWIFALWGLFDWTLINDCFADEYNKTCKTMAKHLPDFSCNYWSMYTFGKMIASPFYHRLHIEQLTVMHKMTGIEIFGEYADLWRKYSENKFYRMRAFLKKAYQKIME